MRVLQSSMKHFYKLLSFILIIFLVISSSSSLKIAVIGSGIGGLATSYYLLNSTNVTVDIFEKENRTGGRIYSRLINGTNITDNLGASFFIKENLLINEIISSLKLPYKNAKDDDLSTEFGFLKNRTILFTLPNSKFLTFFKVLYRFGLSPFYAQWVLEKNLKKFQNIYSFLNIKTQYFTSVREMIREIQLEPMLNKTIKEFLLEEGISLKYIDDVISAFIAGIYNQHSEINAFAGFVTLAGVGYTPLSIVGGNSVLVNMMVDHLSKYLARFKLYLNTKIDKIVKVQDKYKLISKSNNYSELYDYVIVACPLMKTGITFEKSNETIKFQNVLPSKFQVNHKTYVEGQLNSNYFGYNNEEALPEALLSVDKKLSFNSSEILQLTIPTVNQLESETKDKQNKFYVIQGDLNLTHQGLINIFKPGFKIIDRHVWDFAYPQLIPIKDYKKNNKENEKIVETDISFFIDEDEKILHLNAIETASSCMELSIISAKNIAKIIQNREYLFEVASENKNPYNKKSNVNDL